MQLVASHSPAKQSMMIEFKYFAITINRNREQENIHTFITRHVAIATSRVAL